MTTSNKRTIFSVLVVDKEVYPDAPLLNLPDGRVIIPINSVFQSKPAWLFDGGEEVLPEAAEALTLKDITFTSVRVNYDTFDKIFSPVVID